LNLETSLFRWLALLLLSALTACASAESKTTPTPTPTRVPAPTLVPTPTALPPLRIVTLGDSLTSGDKDAEPGGGWPRRLQALLADQRPEVRVLNLAQPGWTSGDLLRGVDAAPNQIDQAMTFLQAANGDTIATVWIGVNDLFYLYESGDPTSAEEAQEADRFERDLGGLLDRLHSAGARVFIALLHDPAQGPVQTSGVFRSTTAEEWTRLSQQARRYNDIIRSVAAKYDAALVDISATRIFSTPGLMFEDGIHPNARGYEELAQVWLSAIGADAR
jgi:lysophospholipase L1-like esterase